MSRVAKEKINPKWNSLTRGQASRSPDAGRAGAATTAGDDLLDVLFHFYEPQALVMTF